MRKTTRWFSIVLASALVGGLLLNLAPVASAQRGYRRAIIVEPVPGPFFYPFYPYGYYPYPGYVAANLGEIKIDTHRKDASVYIDGGFAATTDKARKFALRPGTHDVELRDSDGHTFYQESVAVTVGQTTKLHVS